MKKITLFIILLCACLVVPIYAEETDYSYLEDMSIKELKELDAEIHKLLGDSSESENEEVQYELDLSDDDLELLTRGLEKIRDGLKDPDSFYVTFCDLYTIDEELEKAVDGDDYNEDDAFLKGYNSRRLYVEYMAKNSYGGYTEGHAYAYYDEEKGKYYVIPDGDGGLKYQDALFNYVVTCGQYPQYSEYVNNIHCDEDAVNAIMGYSRK